MTRKVVQNTRRFSGRGLGTRLDESNLAGGVWERDLRTVACMQDGNGSSEAPPTDFSVLVHNSGDPGQVRLNRIDNTVIV